MRNRILQVVIIGFMLIFGINGLCRSSAQSLGDERYPKGWDSVYVKTAAADTLIELDSSGFAEIYEDSNCAEREVYYAEQYLNFCSEINEDQTMSNPFEVWQQEGVTICSSEDGAIRTFSWDVLLEGPECGYNTVVQYRVTDSLARLLWKEERWDGYKTEYENLFGTCHIEKVHCIDKGIYLLEGSSQNSLYGRGSTLFAYDINSGIIKKAFLFKSDSVYLNHISFNYTINDSLTDNLRPAFKIEDNKLFVPVIDSTGVFRGEYSTLYYNFGFFQTAEEYTEEIAKYEKGKYYITRILIKDPWNFEAPDVYYQGGKLSVLVNIGHLYGDDTYLIKEDNVDLTLDCDFFKGEPVIDIWDLLLINNAAYVENVNVNSLCIKIVNSRWQRLWLWAKPQRVLDVAGITDAIPYQKLRYTVVRFTHKPKETERKNVRWILEFDGERQLLDPEIYSGPQIELTMQPEWEDKTIRVIPYLKHINDKVYVVTEISEKFLGGKKNRND